VNADRRRELQIAEYSPRDDDEAVALERRCPQGGRLRLSFRRDAFRLRSELYAEWQIWTARIGGRLVGVTASAIKTAALSGEPLRAGFAYDLRVDPAWRGAGIARRLMTVAHEWAFERAELGYTYSVAGNDVAERLISSFGASRAGGYEYLILPAWRELPCAEPDRIPVEDAYERHVAAEGPFDLHTPPDFPLMRAGHVRSWRTAAGRCEASCSAWNAGAILGETLETAPLEIRIARRLSRAPGLQRLRWPRIPDDGEAIRSWYLYDVTAQSAAAARSLARAVARDALAAGVDWLYWIAPSGAAWVPGVLADAPKIASLRLPYVRMLQLRDAPTHRVRRSYVDIRDV